MIASTLIIFLMQPSLEPRNFTFWIPAATMFIIIFVWFVTASTEARNWQKNKFAVLSLIAVIYLIIFTRYFEVFQFLPVSPPRPQIFALALMMLLLGLAAIHATGNRYNIWLTGLIFLIVLLFIFIRVPVLLQTASAWAAILLGHTLTIPSPLYWFGYSYIAFRLLHTIRDRQANRLPDVTMDEFVNYVIFFPALSAGPIDRIERFVPELRQPQIIDGGEWVDIIKRVFGGLFKKFIIADTLAIMALDDGLAQNIHSTMWMWIAVYAFAFQIYFDFSGYTDIAIGMGRLLGIHLPENFLAPYLKPNITQFWSNWHITLTQWFRAYYFNPVTRSLRKTKLPTWASLAFVQVSTMILIGLWHGITPNFVIWGVWHGIGLFVHKQWSDWARLHVKVNALSAGQQKFISLTGILLTFHFVAIGWVFFTLSSPTGAWHTLIILLGYPK
jgi:D-alanyl-lipoteichoic acid acyltransferase DltB (MBOAT superfamily)